VANIDGLGVSVHQLVRSAVGMPLGFTVVKFDGNADGTNNEGSLEGALVTE